MKKFLSFLNPNNTPEFWIILVLAGLVVAGILTTAVVALVTAPNKIIY